MNKDKFSFYKEHPKSCKPTDFWGQVKRTVNGKAVSQDQIDMIVDASIAGLDLNRDDLLLDICCGNGALTNLLFDHCRGGLGVDFSEYLISIANQNFAKEPSRTYLLGDVVEFCLASKQPEKFTKAICYGSFSYLEHDRAKVLLKALYDGFPNLKQVFIGNCPDKTKVKEFFNCRPYKESIVTDPSSAIGIWRSGEEFILLAESAGWSVSLKSMPVNFYASLYRYDVVLSRV